MKKILLILIPVLGLIGGGGAGLWLRPAPEPTHDEAPPAPEDHDTVSFAFPKQFFVPVIRGTQPESVMVLNLALDVVKSDEEEIFKQELRLRDALLRQLLIHANTGGFDGNFTSEAHLKELRAKLLRAAQSVAGDQVKAVLISDIARQMQ